MKIVAVIPARYKSSRFEGKPLALINGKPMIWWVYNQATQVEIISEVVVATDDSRIYDACVENHMHVCMTSEDNLTGTDRVAEVAEKYAADVYINIQGDEPLIEPATIRRVLDPFIMKEDVTIVNLMTEIKLPVDLANSTVPKVITNADNYAVFLTRAVAPFPKGSLDVKYYKQVCVYAYTAEELTFFREYGKKYGKAKVESIEDIEILRFIENGHKVKFIEVESETVAVDTPKDLQRVKTIMEAVSR